MNAQPPDFETKALPKAGWAVFAVLMALLAWAFFSVHNVKDTKLQGYPLVVADPSKLNFGERKAGERFEWKLTIRNRTDKPLALARFQTSCDCTSVSPPSISVAPSSSVEITATIVARKLSPGRMVQVDGLDELGMRIFSTYVHGKVLENQAEQREGSIE
jgi:hypothetical protein